MNDETLRISVSLLVGLNVCLTHQCRCGETVQSDGLHPLSCRFSAGRFPQHSAINNIMKRSHDTAGLHSILEPVGLDRNDGGKPDGKTSLPFKGGKALAWDATCTDLFSNSNLCSTILKPGSASSATEHLKRRKYSQLVADFEFVPVAVETSGIIGSAGCSLLTDISRRISRSTNDPRQMSYIFQRIYVAIIRCNVLAEHIGLVVRMSIWDRGRRFEPQHQYVFSLSKRLYPHCFSRLSCEMSTRWGQPREGYSVL